MSNQNIIRLTATPKSFGDTPDEIEAKLFESELPIQNTHSFYENEEIGLYVGLWDTTDMIEKSGGYACDEFMWVLEGQVEIKNMLTGKKQTVEAGEAFVIPKGFDCQWCQTGYLRKFYFISEHPEEDIPTSPVIESIIKLNSNNTSAINNPSNTNKAAKPFSRKQDYIDRKINVAYENHNGKFYFGSWNSDSFESEFLRSSANELVCILDGTLILTDGTGKQYQFKKDDAFFVPQDIICKWKSEAPVKTLYVALES